ncbi:MAG: hypothetical protein DRP78_04315 [Candidatus Omnitrophota bacterium]|nr:MAG: hypothetical protein DRP78_04315 [Candidatus Omnitrophota bacterium]
MGVISALLAGFLGIFIAIDWIGEVPVFFSFSTKMTQQRREILSRMVYNVAGMLIGFIFLSKIICWLMGIEAADLEICTGIFLLVFSITVLLKGKKDSQVYAGFFSFIRGLFFKPQLLFLLVVFSSLFGIVITLLSLALNIVIVFLLLKYVENIVLFLKPRVLEALSKVNILFLCMLGAMLLRNGLLEVF